MAITCSTDLAAWHGSTRNFQRPPQAFAQLLAPGCGACVIPALARASSSAADVSTLLRIAGPAHTCRLRLTTPMILNNVLVMEPLGYAMRMSDQLDATFLALADPTRRAILGRLAHGEASVGELAAPFDISQPAISKHLRILERAALISVGQDAQRRPRRIEAKPLAEASAWIEGFRQIWEANFERLDSLLEELQRDRPSKRGHKVKGKPR
jgi:DNA-binding transcriptional ArsR family regulator